VLVTDVDEAAAAAARQVLQRPAPAAG
jgi:hypothetical protein